MLNIFSLVGVGFLAAGIVLIATRATGWKRPAFVLPLAVGGSMLAFPVWNEYSWYARTRDGLPGHIQVVRTYDHKSMWQFWTWVIPRVDRFVAVDRSRMRRNPGLPGHVMVDTLLVKRDEPTLRVVNLFDCEGGRRAEIAPDAAFDDRGLPVDAGWIGLDADEPLLKAACEAD